MNTISPSTPRFMPTGSSSLKQEQVSKPKSQPPVSPRFGNDGNKNLIRLALLLGSAAAVGVGILLKTNADKVEEEKEALAASLFEQKLRMGLGSRTELITEVIKKELSWTRQQRMLDKLVLVLTDMPEGADKREAVQHTFKLAVEESLAGLAVITGKIGAADAENQREIPKILKQYRKEMDPFDKDRLEDYNRVVRELKPQYPSL